MRVELWIIDLVLLNRVRRWAGMNGRPGIVDLAIASLIAFCAWSSGCGRGGDGGTSAGGIGSTASEAGSGNVVLQVKPGDGKQGEGVHTQGVARNRVDLGDDVLVVSVPDMILLAGSMTGTRGRDPASEMDLVPVQIHAFQIDRYAYPNERDAAPRIDVTLAEARDLCKAAGKRLCTELEWEAACKSPAGNLYPYGPWYDQKSYGTGPDALSSDLGVGGMGSIEEWTDSEFKLPENPLPRGQVIRGAAPDGTYGRRRCAARGYRLPENSSSALGFRCCSGPRNDEEVVLEGLLQPFDEVSDMADSKFSELVGAIPEMSGVAGDPKRFGASDLDYVLLRRNIDPRTSYAGYIFTTNPVWWHPVRGEELLAFTGFSGEDSFVVALYNLGDGRFKHASSMILYGKGSVTVKVPLPVILVAGVDRDVLNWGPCWNCSEGGALYYEGETGLIQVSHRW